jgi:hypothetical protein
MKTVPAARARRYRAAVLVISLDVAARRQTGGGIAHDELNNRRPLLRAMNL